MNAEQIANGLDRARRSGRSWSACCPAHEDRSPSLSITDTGDGKVLVHCFAGCSQEDVIESLRGLGLWPTASYAARAMYAERERQKIREHHLLILRLADIRLQNGEQLDEHDSNVLKESLRYLGRAI